MSVRIRYNLDKKGVKHKSDLINLGEQLKEIRLSYKHQQESFAKKIGFTETYINEIENGKWLPSYNFFKKLAEVFPKVGINIYIRKGFIEVFFLKIKKNKEEEIVFEESLKKERIEHDFIKFKKERKKRKNIKMKHPDIAEDM